MPLTRDQIRDMLRVIPQEQFEALTVEWENRCGYDSHPTIERVYEFNERAGTYGCPVPRCTVRRGSPRTMWMHVHLIHPPDPQDLAVLEQLVTEARTTQETQPE